MSEFPNELTWRDFEHVLKKLGYEPCKSKAGSARTFTNPHRDPEFVTFHEPHGKDRLRKGTLREYVRKLNLGREELLEMLNS